MGIYNNRITVFSTGGGGADIRDAEPIINDDKWHHAAATWGANGAALYLDGDLVGSNSGNRIKALPASPSVIIGSYLKPGSGYKFPGLIDDVRIYNQALSQEQVQYIMNNETFGVPVTATVPEELSFTISSDTCSLGSLDANTTSTCTHTMSASTNATNGYVISYLPTTTLTSSSLEEIEETGATGAIVSTGTEQFGFNLVDNSNPDVGADASGGVGVVSTNYNTANTFSFNLAGATIASSSTPSMPTTYTATYIANIASDTPAGEYSTTVTYVITASY